MKKAAHTVKSTAADVYKELKAKCMKELLSVTGKSSALGKTDKESDVIISAPAGFRHTVNLSKTDPALKHSAAEIFTILDTAKPLLTLSAPDPVRERSQSVVKPLPPVPAAASRNPAIPPVPTKKPPLPPEGSRVQPHLPAANGQEKPATFSHRDAPPSPEFKQKLAASLKGAHEASRFAGQKVAAVNVEWASAPRNQLGRSSVDAADSAKAPARLFSRH